MSKTREQLRISGVLLAGPVVPGFFKLASDGCSVPTGFLRKFLKADQTKAACRIHDYSYYLINICCEIGSKDHKHKRHIADATLRWNRTKIGKNWITGQIFGRLYYRGVRFGGGNALRKKHGKLIAPPSEQALEAVRKDCIEFCQPHSLTKRAKKKLRQWEKQIKESQ